MTTLYLDPDSWDLAVDASRRIALASLPYEAAQTTANACRLWRGEAPYNNDRGIPYETEILGKNPPIQLMKTWYELETLTVPNVESATIVLEFDRTSRKLGGQIQITLTDGTTGINVNV